MVVVTGPIASELAALIGLEEVFAEVWDLAKWPLIALFVLTVYAVLYWASPDVRERGFQWFTPGGMIATVAWVLGSLAYAVYISAIANYDELYGSLGAVIGFLIWLWLSNQAMLFGVELDAGLERKTWRCDPTDLFSARARAASAAPGRSGRARRAGRVGEPDPGRLGDRDRVEADPLADRHPVQVDAQVDVDEQVTRPVERRADPVAGVGRDQHPLQRSRLLAGDQRVAHPHPDTVAGPGLEEALRRRTGTPSPCGSRRPGRWRRTAPATAAGGVAGVAASGAVDAGEAGGQLDRRRASAPGRGPDQLARRRAASDAESSSTLRPGRTTSALTVQRRDRHRPQDLEGDPADLPARLRRGLERSSARAISAAGGPACWSIGVPGPAGELG